MTPSQVGQYRCLWIDESNSAAIGVLMDEYLSAGWEMEGAELIGEDTLVILGLWDEAAS